MRYKGVDTLFQRLILSVRPMRKLPPADRQLRRVLLVDDNRQGLKVRKKVLEDHGLVVSICDSPTDALELFSNSEFDVVITDYRMPVMSGDCLIRELRNVRPATPAILISGFVEALGLNESNTGADAVVAKNANEIPNLLRAVERVLNPPTPRKPPGSHNPISRNGASVK